MYFPNADVVVHPALLVFLGVIVGMLGGFFGVGGGFLITGGLLVFGVPPVYAVGTGLTLVMGTSIINTFKHRSLGNVDFKLGALMVTGTIPAIFLAEWPRASPGLLSAIFTWGSCRYWGCSSCTTTGGPVPCVHSVEGAGPSRSRPLP